jgi:hypothetical protein
MSGGSFRSVFMVASCAGAALGCYLVSLRVASERAALEQVETEIVLAKRDIRVLQTEIGTRGRLAQLERWNVKVLSLSAPSADQFLGGGFELARLVQPKRRIDIEAPVVLAAAPVNAPKPQVERATAAEEDVPDLSPKALMQTVSLKRELPAEPLAKPKPAKATAAEKAKPAAEKSSSAEKAEAAKPKATAADKAKRAVVDPLAPLKTAAAKPKKLAASAAAKEPTKTP